MEDISHTSVLETCSEGVMSESILKHLGTIIHQKDARLVGHTEVLRLTDLL